MWKVNKNLNYLMINLLLIYRQDVHSAYASV